MIHVPVEPTEPLFKPKPNKRDATCKKFAALIWRETDIDKIAAKLNDLYEWAYSNGGADRDKLYQKLDK